MKKEDVNWVFRELKGKKKCKKGEGPDLYKSRVSTVVYGAKHAHMLKGASRFAGCQVTAEKGVRVFLLGRHGRVQTEIIMH